ncbi:MAG: 50S ribosomal protein L22 [Candidatus Paceibacterota bacterium]
MKATLKQYRQSPRKVRLVADSIRGKSVNKALAELRFVSRRASGPIEKLLKSAVSNAEKNSNKDREKLFVKEIRVDEGITMKRMMPRSRGRGFRINKRASHITLELGERQEAKKQESKKTQEPKHKAQAKHKTKNEEKELEKKQTKVVKKEKALKNKK